MIRILILALLLTLPGGCIVYRIDIQQGNEITNEMLSELQIGMNRRDVVKVLGYPLIEDPFHADRWDYYFYRKDGKSGDTEQWSATLLFDENGLREIREGLRPEDGEEEGAEGKEGEE